MFSRVSCSKFCCFVLFIFSPSSITFPNYLWFSFRYVPPAGLTPRTDGYKPKKKNDLVDEVVLADLVLGALFQVTLTVVALEGLEGGAERRLLAAVRLVGPRVVGRHRGLDAGPLLHEAGVQHAQPPLVVLCQASERRTSFSESTKNNSNNIVSDGNEQKKEREAVTVSLLGRFQVRFGHGTEVAAVLVQLGEQLVDLAAVALGAFLEIRFDVLCPPTNINQ